MDRHQARYGNGEIAQSAQLLATSNSMLTLLRAQFPPTIQQTWPSPAKRIAVWSLLPPMMREWVTRPDPVREFFVV
jgi:hypothetical protein